MTVDPDRVVEIDDPPDPRALAHTGHDASNAGDEDDA